MKNYKMIIGTVVSTALVAGFGVGAQAQTTIAGVYSANTQNNTQFTSAPGGDGLVVTYSDGVFSSKSGGSPITGVKVSFTATGGSTTILGGGNFNEIFAGGGTFSAFNGSIDLLSGTFFAGEIDGKSGQQTGSFGATGVTYDAASTMVPAGDSFLNGLLTLTFNPINGGYALSSTGKLQTFTATDAAVYSAVQTTVPEPASVIPFALGGLGLLGLIVRKTRRTSGAAA